MSDLRACAEWIAANVDRLEAHAKRRHEQLTELEIRSRELARAVLSSLDVPDREQLLRIVEHLEGDIRRGKPGMEFYAPLAAHTRRTLGEST